MGLTAAVYVKFGQPHHVQWTSAFSEGLMRHGIRVKTLNYQPEKVEDADFHVFWAMKASKVIRHCHEMGQPIVCLDRGYTDDRMYFTSINLNGLNGMSELDVSDFSQDSSRCEMHGWRIKERKILGENIIISGQVAGDASLGGINIYDWVDAQVSALNAAGLGDKVFFKPHPLEETEHYPRIQSVQARRLGMDCSMDDAYELARLFLTYSSTVGANAWLNGVPALAASSTSMIFRDQFGDNTPRARQEWLNRISFRQFSEEEFSSGFAWELLANRIIGKAPARKLEAASLPHQPLVERAKNLGLFA